MGLMSNWRRHLRGARGNAALALLALCGLGFHAGLAAADVPERCNRADPAFAPIADPVADPAMGHLLNMLSERMQDPEWQKHCHMPSFGTQESRAGGTRNFDKYDAYFLAAAWFWFQEIKGESLPSDIGRCARLMKTISWYESKVGYASGFTNREKNGALRFPLQAEGWVDTEDVMQVGNPADLPIHEKLEEMSSLNFANAQRIADLVPRGYTHRNISGAQSIFYGTAWFGYKYLTCGRVPGEAVRRYNGNTSIDAWNGRQHRDNYAESVTILFKTGVARSPASGEELILVKP